MHKIPLSDAQFTIVQALLRQQIEAAPEDTVALLQEALPRWVDVETAHNQWCDLLETFALNDE